MAEHHTLIMQYSSQSRSVLVVTDRGVGGAKESQSVNVERGNREK